MVYNTSNTTGLQLRGDATVRVIIADDQLPNRDLLRDILEPDGYDLVMASSGLEAVRICQEQQPDLMLLDLEMPELDGFGVLSQIRSLPETRLMPVVVVTAHGARSHRLRAADLGADDFIAKPIDVLELRTRVRAILRFKAYLDEYERVEGVLLSLARIVESRDPDTGDHCERIARNSNLVGTELGLAERDLRALHLAAHLHDIGKIAIPDSILLKHGPLNAAERRAVEVHPEIGERILVPLRSVRDVVPLVRHHHERLNGSGYPDGLRSADIPQSVRVLSVCDVFDALTSRRPYREPLPAEQALAILDAEVAKGYWDAEVVAALRRVLARRH